MSEFCTLLNFDFPAILWNRELDYSCKTLSQWLIYLLQLEIIYLGI